MSAAIILHAVLMVASLAWANALRRQRPSSTTAWRLGILLVGMVVPADALAFASGYVPSLAAMLFALGVIGGIASLLLALLQGWPNRGLVAVGVFAVIAPFVAAT